MVVGVRVESAVGNASEHPAFVLPDLPGLGLLRILMCAMFLEKCDELRKSGL